MVERKRQRLTSGVRPDAGKLLKQGTGSVPEGKGDQWDSGLDEDEAVFDKVFDTLAKTTLSKPVRAGGVLVLGYDPTHQDAVVRYKGRDGLLSHFQDEGFNAGEDRFTADDVKDIQAAVKEGIEYSPIKWKYTE